MKVKTIGKYIGHEVRQDGIDVTFHISNFRYMKYFMELPREEMSITLSEPRNKRSNEQNRLMWKLIHEIAENPNSYSNDDMEMYCYFLEKCNQGYTYMTVVENALDSLKEMARVVQIIGYETRKNGTRFAKCRVWLGSSKFSTEEMSKMIDVIIEYASNLDIDVSYYKEMLL